MISISQWHLIAHASELATPGDFVCLQRDPQPDMAVMNADGEIVAFDNRCPHRGARIFTELRGNRPPVCRYHGRCARAQDVVRLRTAWVGDWLFVGPLWSRDVHPISKDSGIRPFLAESPQLRHHSTVELVYPCHWTIAIENALDNEHVAHVHRSSLAKMQLHRIGLQTEGNGSSIEIFSSGFADRLDQLARHFATQRDFDYMHAHVHPFACVASTRGWTYSLQHYLPRSDGRTHFISRMFVQADSTSAGARQLFSTAAEMNALVFQEDLEVVALVPRASVCHMGPLDDRVRHFRATGARTVAA